MKLLGSNDDLRAVDGNSRLTRKNPPQVISEKRRPPWNVKSRGLLRHEIGNVSSCAENLGINVKIDGTLVRHRQEDVDNGLEFGGHATTRQPPQFTRGLVSCRAEKLKDLSSERFGQGVTALDLFQFRKVARWFGRKGHQSIVSENV